MSVTCKLTFTRVNNLMFKTFNTVRPHFHVDVQRGEEFLFKCDFLVKGWCKIMWPNINVICTERHFRVSKLIVGARRRPAICLRQYSGGHFVLGMRGKWRRGAHRPTSWMEGVSYFNAAIWQRGAARRLFRIPLPRVILFVLACGGERS